MSDEQKDEIYNRPGQSALAYRATTRSASLQRMKARLHAYTIASGPNAGRQPLGRLTTRDATDPALGFLDAWATALDVLTFYQERVANEGYLRTATEPRSLQELAQTLGYEPAPAIAATTYLAYTVADTKGSPSAVAVAAGAKVMSVPGPGELPQTFETATSLTAQVAHNTLQPLLLQPQVLVASDDAGVGIAVTSLRLAGLASGLVVGDVLRIATKTTVEVTAVTPQAALKITEVTFKVLTGPALRVAPRPMGSAVPQEVVAFREKLGFFGNDAPPWSSLLKLDSTYLYGTDIYAVPSTTTTTTASDTSDPSDSSVGPRWDDDNHNNKRTIWVNSWNRRYRDCASGCDVFLTYSPVGLVAGSTLLIRCGSVTSAYTIDSIVETTVLGYGRTQRTTGLKLTTRPASVAAARSDVYLTRSTTAYIKSETLTLAETVPLLVSAPVSDRLMLDTIVPTLAAGQPVVVSGERADGTTVSEVVRLGHVEHSGTNTTIYFAPPLAASYVLTTVRLAANLVLASHGETIDNEILGSGDAAKINQRFALRRSPLTYLSAANERGCAAELEVRVSGVLWRQTASLLDEDGGSPCYCVQRDYSGSATVIFGDGEHGARLPSGQDNVVARYRIGSGPDGAVTADSLKLLLTRPLGLKSVVNPLPASGAAAADSSATIRQDTPISVYTLGRAVSLSDYETLAAAYPGIGKARAEAVMLGGTAGVHITIASQDGAPLPRTSALYQGLLNTLIQLGDPTQPLILEDYVRREFRLSGGWLYLDPRYDAATVQAQVSAALQQRFAFAARSLGQSVQPSEILHTVQQVPGVRGVVLDRMYFVSGPLARAAVLPAAGGRVDQNGRSIGAELLVIAADSGYFAVQS